MGVWLILGEQVGCRRLEWAQECSHLNKYNTYQRNFEMTLKVIIDNHNDEEVER